MGAVHRSERRRGRSGTGRLRRDGPPAVGARVEDAVGERARPAHVPPAAPAPPGLPGATVLGATEEPGRGRAPTARGSAGGHQPRVVRRGAQRRPPTAAADRPRDRGGYRGLDADRRRFQPSGHRQDARRGPRQGYGVPGRPASRVLPRHAFHDPRGRQRDPLEIPASLSRRAHRVPAIRNRRANHVGGARQLHRRAHRQQVLDLALENAPVRRHLVVARIRGAHCAGVFPLRSASRQSALPRALLPARAHVGPRGDVPLEMDVRPHASRAPQRAHGPARERVRAGMGAVQVARQREPRHDQRDPAHDLGRHRSGQHHLSRRAPRRARGPV